MTFLLCFGVGLLCLLVGILIGRKTIKIDGLFVVDDSDEETTRWTIDVKFDPSDILNKKELRLLVKKLYEGDV